MRSVISMVFVIALAVSGCATSSKSTTPRRSPFLVVTPIENVAKSDQLSIKSSPVECRDSECKMIELVIDNASDRPIEIDWTRTQFVDNGQTRGGFIWEGIRFMEKDAVRAPDIVPPHSKFTKRLLPSVNVDYDGGRYGSGWVEKGMGNGEKGIYVTMRDGERELGVKLTSKISVEWLADRPHYDPNAVSANQAQIIVVRGPPATSTPTASGSGQ